MLRLLSRLIAVLALAVSPLISVSVAQATTRDEWPVYPSLFYSPSTCNVANNFVVCQPGGLMQSQINSGYQCNEIDVVMHGLANGPVNITLSADSQSVSQTLSINEDGTYYVQFPGFLVNNLVSLEFSMPDGAAFPLPTIYSSPCPVATATPIPSSTSTPNPSFTPTATINPSYTVTPIPTYTPLPSGHSTFTPTRTPVATATGTPAGPSEFNCGDATFPLLNCTFLGTIGRVTPPDHWTFGIMGDVAPVCSGPDNGFNPPIADGGYSAGYFVCAQTVMANAIGNLNIQWKATDTFDSPPGVTWRFQAGGDQLNISALMAACPTSGSTWCYSTITNITSTGPTSFAIDEAGGGEHTIQLVMQRVWIGSVSATPTPGPSATSTATALGSPTATQIPNPFGTVTPVPSDTECPGGCAVTDLTQVPGLSTVVTVDTNPFSPLTHLSLTRSSCQPFGYVQIPIPVITGTPALGQPLQFGWTAPITHTWDDTHLITNTAIQPCAMVGEVSPYVWDFTYWGSGVALAIVFTIWLIGWVGRLSGDHTIDG